MDQTGSKTRSVCEFLDAMAIVTLYDAVRVSIRIHSVRIDFVSIIANVVMIRAREKSSKAIPLHFSGSLTGAVSSLRRLSAEAASLERRARDYLQG